MRLPWIKDSALIINYETYSNYEKWLDGGEFSLEIIPDNYGQAKKLQYICSDDEKDLDPTKDRDFFKQLGNVVRFMLEVLNIGEYAASKINTDLRLPFIIDPSCGSGTFLIEAMKYITKTVQTDEYKLLKKTAKIKERLNGWFLPDAPNYWAREFIYGIEDDVDLALSTKVNMVLHGDGNINVFHRDGLKEFSEYKRISETGEPEATKLSYSSHGKDGKFPAYEMNEQFEIIISNPPFSIKVTEQDQKDRRGRFYFNSKKNSENLFIERWYQLLAPQGRLAVVLPESVFDTTENKYIRLFLYRHFNIKAVVSLPQLTFEPYTSTKTSLLFATKKTKEEVGAWDAEWRKQEAEYGKLRGCETVKFILQNEKLLNSGDCLNKLISDLDLDIYLNSNILDKDIFTNELKKQIISSKKNLTDDKWLKKDKKGKDKIDTLLEEIDEFVREEKLNKIKDVAREISALKKLLKHHFPKRIKSVANDEEHEFKMAAEAEEGYYTHDDLK